MTTKKYVSTVPQTSTAVAPQGSIDLTYRCNNHCRHCWLRLPENAAQQSQELTFRDIVAIIKKGMAAGCRHWAISGGEPLLRPDFGDILEYLLQTRHSYALNTNGTRITPAIARLLKAKGTKMVSMYGPNAEVHDHITRKPGSFDAFMQGCSYLKEAGAGFIIQIVPLQDNKHLFTEMLTLAETLSPHARIGAGWLYLSETADPSVNAEILRQRIAPAEMVQINPPDLSCTNIAGQADHDVAAPEQSIFGKCLAGKTDFHINPYGRLSFCGYINHEALRYDILYGSFAEYHQSFLPAAVKAFPPNAEFRHNCGSCAKRQNCLWCPAFAYLEHGRFSAGIDYLCKMAEETTQLQENWQKNNRRTLGIADISIILESDIPFTSQCLAEKFANFVARPVQEDVIVIRHHQINSAPAVVSADLDGKELFQSEGLTVAKIGDKFILYKNNHWHADDPADEYGVFQDDFSKADIYHADKRFYEPGAFSSTTATFSDQILLAQLLAERQGGIFHAGGIIHNGNGFLFIGRSGAGKSTICSLFPQNTALLSEDRVIVRRQAGQCKVYGTWFHDFSHNTIPGPAPLRAIFFLNQSPTNGLEQITKENVVVKRLLPCLIRAVETNTWWQKTLDFLSTVAGEVPAYDLFFDRSGDIVGRIDDLFPTTYAAVQVNNKRDTEK
jgi:MoaA/NifB/PqqE/SkfB family radical SAM enzyme